MSGFSGRTEKPLEGTITNDGFYPDLSLLEFQEDYRIRSEYRTATITQEITAAAFEINRLLKERRVFWLDEYLDEHDLTTLPDDPALTLQDLPCMQLGELHEFIEFYKTAVFAKAKAALIPLFDSQNRRDRADDEDDEQSQIAAFENKSRHALNQLLGETDMRGSVH